MKGSINWASFLLSVKDKEGWCEKNDVLEKRREEAKRWLRERKRCSEETKFHVIRAEGRFKS